MTRTTDGYYATYQSATKRVGRQVEWTRDLTADEQYAQRLFFSVHAVVENLDQIRQTGLFLSGFRSTARLKAHDITRFDHIIYHVENFLLRATGCLDRCLVLVNDAMDLGLNHEDCNYRLIRSISHVRSSPVQGVLGEINGIVKPYKDHRNIVAHRSRHTDEKLDNIQMFDIVLKHEYTDSKYHGYKYWSDKYVKAKKEEIERVAGDLYVSCGRLFDKLELGAGPRLSRLQPSV